MPFPENITKDDLLQAIGKIDSEGYDFRAESSYYDVIYNGKRYPPKLVVSFANIFANGEELDRKQFEGGVNTPAFRLLERFPEDFTIVKKESNTNERKVWFVTQGATYTPERGMKFLFAPAAGSDGNSRFYWKNLLKVRKGDIIFNYSEGLKGVSTATSDGYQADNDDPNSQWGEKGFRVDIDLTSLSPFLSRHQLADKKNELNQYLSLVTNKPFNNVGGVNQGYLYEFSKEAGRFIRDLYGKNFGNKTLDYFFDEVHLVKLANPNTNTLFNYRFFQSLAQEAGYLINKKLNLRFIASLLTKPFVILTGLSGSGKTKLVQALAMWICEDEDQYCVVPVGADWINREPLLGYPNSLDVSNYLMPDNGVLDLIIKASKEDNQNKPYFLILDEMNLSHVERYFADFLSVMESRDSKGILLHSDKERKDTSDAIIPNSIILPGNLFIIGTVNIDETTYMFSPKVLDRANVIEFRITKDEMKNFFEVNETIRLESLKGLGAPMASSFISLASNRNLEMAREETAKEIADTLLSFFDELKKIGAEFGYRSASEILRFGAIVNTLEPGWKVEEIIDAAIMQKLLPKLHGSRSKLAKVLITLGKLCVEGDRDVKKEIFDKHNEIDFETEPNISYRISLEKISRMHKNVIEHGFTSYAEA